MSGEEFVKKIRPIGCVVFLLLSVGMIVTCLFSGRDPIRGYTPPQDAAYYGESRETLAELQTELETNVFPNLEGILKCRNNGQTLEITIESDDFAVTRAAILRYFDKSLFSFQEG